MTAPQSLHIGIVLPSVPGYSEVFFRNKISGLLKHGVKVTLFVKNPANISDFLCPVKVHPMLHKSGFLRIPQSVWIILKLVAKNPKHAVGMFRVAKNNGYSLTQALKAIAVGSSILSEDLDWVHFGFATTAVERELVGKAMGAKVAVSLRGFDISVFPLKNQGCYSLLWSQVDKVHTISDDLLELAFHNGLPRFVPHSKITPAIDVGKFQREPKIREANDVPAILTVARLHWKKGLEYTLQALAILKHQMKIDFTYKIVGDGSDLERLIFAAHQLDIDDCVEFLGKVDHDIVAAIMVKSGIYIQYSVQEGFCNSVLEAQAAGCLCVVSDAEGLQENVLNNETGWVVPKRNPRALAEKLLQVIQLNASEKQAVRERAVKRVAREFNLEKQQREFIEFYQS